MEAGTRLHALNSNAFIFFVLVCLFISMRPATAAALELDDCRIEGSGGNRSIAARCGWLEVPENPEQPDGEQINLYVAVVPALSRSAAPAALTVIAGGPGAASTQFFVDYGAAFGRITRDRDVLLVDQRGTGKSNPLQCSFEELEDDIAPSKEAIVRATEECLSGLSGNPRYYTTSVAVRDLEAVRAALGYEQLDVYGASYGTRVALHYLRRFPASTRTVIVDGVLPIDLAIGPDIAINAQIALDTMLQRCVDDDACARQFPDLEDNFADLAARLRAAPIELEMPDPLSGEIETVEFGYEEMAIAVRLLSYATDTVALLPLLISEASTQQNYQPLAAQAVMTTGQLNESLSYGMHNAVVCTEDAPFYRNEHIDVEALTATYLGASQYEMLSELCASWPAGVIDDDFRDPITAERPVLILSGSADPVTPALYGERLLTSLPLALHLIANGQGHGVAGLGCVPRIVEAFVESASLDGIETECGSGLEPAPFFLRFSGAGP